MVKIQFDLAQMTVIDESVNADEYEDMEFVEFLDFLVRIAYQQSLGEDKSISEKLGSFLQEMLALSNGIPYIELTTQKEGIKSQASEDDINAFHRYMTKNDK